MFKERKEIVSKELKENIMAVNHQIEIINKEVKIIFKNELHGYSGVEIAIMEMKNSLKGQI